MSTHAPDITIKPACRCERCTRARIQLETFTNMHRSWFGKDASDLLSEGHEGSCDMRHGFGVLISTSDGTITMGSGQDWRLASV